MSRMWELENAGLKDLWPAVRAPDGFTAGVLERLPTRTVATPAPSLRRIALAAGVVLAVAGVSVASQPEARAGVELFLRQVVLRETTPDGPLRSVPTQLLSLAEAQQRVAWRILEPGLLPAGYALVAVEAGEIHAFASGPTVVLHYQRRTPEWVAELSVTELQPTRDVSEPVEPGAARQVAVGERIGLFIDGEWVDRGGQSAWQRGRLVRLIVEREGLVFVQLQADPRDGWDADRLAEVAASLR
jgi:hypothetical protein